MLPYLHGLTITISLSFLVGNLWASELTPTLLYYREDALAEILKNCKQEEKERPFRSVVVSSKHLTPQETNPFSYTLRKKEGYNNVNEFKDNLKKSKRIPRRYLFFLSSSQIPIQVYKLKENAEEKIKKWKTDSKKEITPKDIATLYAIYKGPLERIENSNAPCVLKVYLFDIPDLERIKKRFSRLGICALLLLGTTFCSGSYYFYNARKKAAFSSLKATKKEKKITPPKASPYVVHPKMTSKSLSFSKKTFLKKKGTFVLLS